MAFHKKAGLRIKDMVKGNWVYRKLRNFRAGIESDISCLKRAFGLARCVWPGSTTQGLVWSCRRVRPRSSPGSSRPDFSPSPAPSPRLAEPGSNSNSDFQKIYGWIGPRNRHSKRNGPKQPSSSPNAIDSGQKIMRLWTDTS